MTMPLAKLITCLPFMLRRQKRQQYHRICKLNSSAVEFGHLRSFRSSFQVTNSNTDQACARVAIQAFVFTVNQDSCLPTQILSSSTEDTHTQVSFSPTAVWPVKADQREHTLMGSKRRQTAIPSDIPVMMAREAKLNMRSERVKC